VLKSIKQQNPRAQINQSNNQNPKNRKGTKNHTFGLILLRVTGCGDSGEDPIEVEGEEEKKERD